MAQISEAGKTTPPMSWTKAMSHPSPRTKATARQGSFGFSQVGRFLDPWWRWSICSFVQLHQVNWNKAKRIIFTRAAQAALWALGAEWVFNSQNTKFKSLQCGLAKNLKVGQASGDGRRLSGRRRSLERKEIV